ncbi:MAG: RNA polymerase sigma factor [Odoribacter splanchnicus]
METRLFIQGVNLKEDQAWKELYNYFYAPLCCYSARLIGDEDAAEDIVQGCLLRLWRSSLCFQDIKIITSYLYRSVYHASLNFLRDRQRAHKLHEKWMKQTYESEVAAIAGAIEEEAISRFYQAISRLPEQQREILLQSANGKKIRDIALSLGISENTVKTQKKRAYFFCGNSLANCGCSYCLCCLNNDSIFFLIFCHPFFLSWCLYVLLNRK